MYPTRVLTGLLAATLAAPLLLAGCDTSALVASYPALSPYVGPRPKASPFALGRGHIYGRVLQESNLPVGDAFVSTGGAYAFTAKFPDGFDEETDTVADRDDDKDRIYVMHDFGEDKGEEPAMRIKRKYPSGTSKDGKYWYLRSGEFLLEGLPEGDVLVTASYGEVKTEQVRLSIFPNFMLTGVEFRLPIPDALAKEADGTDPKIIAWAATYPSTGITMKIAVREATVEGGGQDRQTTIQYDPDPPDVRVVLRSPPGSGGGEVWYYRINYTYATAKTPNGATPFFEVPLAPVKVPRGQQQNFGPSQEFEVPVGSIILKKLFDSSKGLEDFPAIVVAKIQFLDETRTPLRSRSGQPLEVAVPLRALDS